MEVRYKREINHNYMIMDAPAQGGGYECRMLASNSIEGLLKFRVRQYEEQREFYYEITSRQPLNRLLEQRKLKGSELRSLILGIAGVLTKIEEYLLKEEQLILEPDYIYIEPDSFTIYLCLLPGYSCNFPSALSALLQYLLEKINHQDREGVVLAYNLFQESTRENYGMSDLLRHLSGGSDKVFERHEEELEEEETTDDSMSAYDKIWYEEAGEQKIRRGNLRSKHLHMGDRTDSIRPEGKNVIKEQYNVRPNNKIATWMRAAIFLMLSEGAVWYFTGREGLIRYGLWLAGAVFLVVLAIGLYGSRGNSGEEKDFSVEDREVSDARDKVEKKKAGVPDIPIEKTWRFQPESTEDYQARTDREERRREVSHSREEGTVLLSENSSKEEYPVFENLNRDGNNIEIQYIPYVIGKHPELADYCLERPTVSRLHLRVDRKEGVYIVTDLNSTNGTTVEGYRLQANETVSIQNGNIVSIADIRYRFIERKYP